MLDKFILVVIIVASIFLAGCSTANIEKTAKPDVSLTNTYFKAVSFNGTKAEIFDREAHIKFDAKGKIIGFLGCNSFFGSFKTKGKNISFKNIGSTKMMCPNIKTEDTFTRVLQEVKTYKIEGETLIFFNANGKKISTFKAIFF